MGNSLYCNSNLFMEKAVKGRLTTPVELFNDRELLLLEQR